MRLLFVTVAGNAVGLGHLRRCLSIAASATAAGASITFVVFGDVQAETLLNTAGYPYHVHPEDELFHAPATALQTEDSFDAIVADLVYSGFFSSGNPAVVFASMKKLARCVVAIDSLGERSLAVKAPGAPIDILVVPYVTSDQDRAAAIGQRQLRGADYAILPEEYSDMPERRQRENADRMLVTCGGSDPGEWTPVILKGLEAILFPLDVRVIIGPLFDPALGSRISELSVQSSHRIMLIDAPKSLAAHMLWCDIAIAASGLTKYELATTATPALLFSIDSFHEASNRPFAAMGSVVDLGAGTTPDRIADEARRILGDQKLRMKMGAAGRKLVDGKGAQRLVAEMIRKLSCSKTS